MNKWTKIGIVGAVVLVLILVLYFLTARDSDDFVTDSWEETFTPEDKGPYGTYMLKELLDTTGFFGNFIELDEALEETLEDDPDVNDIYFFVGRNLYLDDTASNHLLDFIGKGNSAFIAARYLPEFLTEKIFFEHDYILIDPVRDSTQYFKFSHPNLAAKRYQFDYVHQNEHKNYFWNYYDPGFLELILGDTVITLGTNTANEINFIKIKINQGQLFFHSIPYAFTNICMMKRDGFQYAENLLKHIPPGTMQWDKYNYMYRSKSRPNNNSGGSSDSVLNFIMKNPPLLAAFLILLIGAILYALFKGKRMQDIIPATESKENMSLQYINSLSSLYLKEKKHNKLIRLKEKTFLNFIADHYYIITNKPDHKFIERVAIKSHIPKQDIKAIFDSFDELEQSTSVTDQELIDLHQKIENFYKNCR